MKQKLILSIILSVCSLQVLIAQSDYDPSLKGTPLKDRIYLGGSFGAAISNEYTYVDLSPTLGFQVTSRFSAGPGFTFQYYNYKIYNYSSFIYGPKAFARYQLLNFFFAHAEFNDLFLKYRQTDNLGNVTFVNKNVPGLLLGGGFTPSIGKSRMYIMILYDVLESPYTPYANPVIRIGFDLGL